MELKLEECDVGFVIGTAHLSRFIDIIELKQKESRNNCRKTNISSFTMAV